ncbi:uncharacterized protein N7496_003281 [Penicillium cataractarum]|uniref:AAA+ ATPase domain-containing protein n=1 Tax=Penicillium cataractarum TaxID=2100454 RepID=A0A9W9SLP4_9EURO|nr:uncharacterized protein N7496_003281 [Penicillium cataractarum]KAJ5380853.1 hypothetical protein N7496_003281 [Penicillium cataractarum]
MAPTPGFNAEVAKHHELLSRDEPSATNSSLNGKPQLPEEVVTAPLFSLPARTALSIKYERNYTSNTDDSVYPQYGLLGHRVDDSEDITQDSLVYTNTAAPWSTFICGSQGSGKSHTLSCLLENCLIPSSPAGRLTAPLAGVVFHYDKFTGFSSTQLCEAAYLCSSQIPVRLLVSPTNFLSMKNAYTNLAGLGNVSHMLKIEPMYLPMKGLNISMMKTLMGIDNVSTQPLYIQVVMKILRDMAIANQGRERFDYGMFRRELDAENFIKGQQVPLQMRLDVLESFFEPGTMPNGNGKPRRQSCADDIWKFPKGTLTIIDLSCPFVGPDDACALFNICISLVLKDRHESGRILAFDEAHKFLTATSSEAMELTENLLSIVRQQRHLGTRVLIATQEPTISPILLDLCNLTIIHRFTSPAWFKAIKAHIAGARENAEARESLERDLFRKIVQLSTGEALLFCPTALLDVMRRGDSSPGGLSSSDSGQMTDDEDFTTGDHHAVQLGAGHVHVRVRKRVTADGGRSIIAQ